MKSRQRKMRWTGFLAALMTIAMLVSCTGFFPKPTLSSIAVGPGTPTIFAATTSNSIQMSVIGTYNDGSTGNPPVGWQSSEPSVAAISSNGLVTAACTSGITCVGQTTITATANANPTLTSSTTVTVTVPCIQSIAITPSSPSIPAGSTQQFAATAQTCNGAVDITNVATWVSSNTSSATIDSTGLATGLTSLTSTDITASSDGITSPSDLLTVN
jgi:Bacterial Ig-like domain (group 2)